MQQLFSLIMKINYKIVNKYSKFIFDTRGNEKKFKNKKIIEL